MKTLLTLFTIAMFSVTVSAQKSVELRYNLEKNKTYRVKSSTVYDQTMTMQGAERSSETKSTSYFSLKMLDAKDDHFLAEVKFDTMKTVVSAPYMDLNSAKPGDINSEDPVEVTRCILNRLSNSAILVKFDYSGHVLEILNYNVIAQSVLEGTDSLKGNAVMVKGQLETMVSKKALTGMIEGITACLPNDKVKKGGSWESGFESNNGGVSMAITSTYKLKDIADKKAVIESDVIMEPASAEPTMMNGAEITNELRGLGKSNMEIDTNTGWLISSSSKSQMSGNMNVKAPGQTMSIPIEGKLSTETIAID